MRAEHLEKAQDLVERYAIVTAMEHEAANPTLGRLYVGRNHFEVPWGNVIDLIVNEAARLRMEAVRIDLELE